VDDAAQGIYGGAFDGLGLEKVVDYEEDQVQNL
jgi:hypothetical protein